MPIHHEDTDRFIKIDEAARIIGYSKSWIYHRREVLPFVLRTPSGGLRVSLQRLREWMARSTPSCTSS